MSASPAPVGPHSGPAGVGPPAGISAHPAARVVQRGRTLVLRRAWPRSPGHLLLDYAEGDRHVAGQWLADPARLNQVARATARSAADASDVEVLGKVLLQRRGADRRLPGLALLAADPRTALVVHRPERRAVVRLDRDGDPSRVGWVKVQRVKGAAARQHHDRVAAAGVAVPTVRRRWGGAGWMAHEAATLPGRALLHHGDADLLTAAAATGLMLRRLHHATDATGLPDHDLEAEAGVLRTWHRRLEWVDPHLARRMSAEVARVLGALAALPQPPQAGVLHRDLHDGQVLVDDSNRAGLLDLDTLAVGDPALDLGNLLAHLHLRADQGRLSQADAVAVGQEVLEGYDASRELRHRVQVHHDVAAARLRCVYALRPVPLADAG